MSEQPPDPPFDEGALPAPSRAPADPANLDADTQARLQALDARLWIPYTAVRSIIRRIEGFMVHPVTDRMPSLSVVARSFNGKTSLLSYLQRRYNPKPLPPGQRSVADMPAPTCPVFVFQAPSEPNVDRFLDNVLAKLNMLGSKSESRASKVQRICVMFDALEVKLVGIDEFGFMNAGTPNQQTKALNGLKAFFNDIRRCIVLTTVEEGLNVLQSNEEIANRFEPMFLPPWKQVEDTAGETSDLTKLLVSYEKFLGLKDVSTLHEPEMAKQILAQGNNILGHMNDLLRRLAKHAIVMKTERITIKDLKPANLMNNIGWVHPNKRHVAPK